MTSPEKIRRDLVPQAGFPADWDVADVRSYLFLLRDDQDVAPYLRVHGIDKVAYALHTMAHA